MHFQSETSVFKFLQRNVDGKHLMRFQSLISVFKFLRRRVDGKHLMGILSKIPSFSQQYQFSDLLRCRLDYQCACEEKMDVRHLLVVVQKTQWPDGSVLDSGLCCQGLRGARAHYTFLVSSPPWGRGVSVTMVSCWGNMQNAGGGGGGGAVI